AYAISGQASASGDQRLHEGVTVEELTKIRVRDVMQKQVTAAEAEWTLLQWAEATPRRFSHAAYPVLDQGRVAGTLTLAGIGKAPPEQWAHTRVREVMNPAWTRVDPDSSLQEALRLLMSHEKHLLMITSDNGTLEGILSQTDILAAMNAAGDRGEVSSEAPAETTP
ncbi:MAG: CBS domain-containing protein, partial [Terriglobales bacterium]